MSSARAETTTTATMQPGAEAGAELRDQAPESDCLGLVGSVVEGRYLVERLVGQGGFGFVYRAKHLRFRSAVALKVLNVPARASRKDREGFFARFAEEGRLAFVVGALHPGIVRVLEAGTLETSGLEPTPYLAMEWLEGSSLRDFLEDRHARGLPPLTVKETIELLDSAVEGLAAAHRERIAHCDVKPANMFLSVQGDHRVAKVLDFGLAEVVADGVAESLSTGPDGRAHGFTSAYAAPEQWLARLGPTGPWTDVHALALVCTELLCGRRALPGGERAQLMAACLDETRRPTPASLGSSLGAELDGVFERALAFSPKLRFPDAGEFWTSLKAVAQERTEKRRSIGGLPTERLAAYLLIAGGGLWFARSTLFASRPEQAPAGATSPRIAAPPPPSPPSPVEATPQLPAPLEATSPASPRPPRPARKPSPKAPAGASSPALDTSAPAPADSVTPATLAGRAASDPRNALPSVEIIRAPALWSRN